VLILWRINDVKRRKERAQIKGMRGNSGNSFGLLMFLGL
jgi:hypothetical protein